MTSMTDAIRRFLTGGQSTPTGPIQAVWNGAVLAESDRTVVVEGNHYFPPEDVNHEYLQASPKRSVCFWKGVASYDDAAVDGQRNAAAASTCPRPSPAARRIKVHVGFSGGVKVRPAPGD